MNGMKIINRDNFECGISAEGKMTQYRNRNPDQRTTAPLELVHIDLAGPIEPADRNGYKYAMAMVDDYSGILMVCFLKKKSDAVYEMENF